MKEVTREEFFKAIGWLDVHPHIQPPEKYPFTELWKTRFGRVKGKTVGRENKMESRYYLPENPNNDGGE